LRAPAADGVIATVTMQLVPVASDPPQLLLVLKSPAFGPVTLMAPNVIAVLPLFSRYTVCEPEGEEIDVAGKLKLVGSTCNTSPPDDDGVSLGQLLLRHRAAQPLDALARCVVTPCDHADTYVESAN